MPRQTWNDKVVPVSAKWVRDEWDFARYCLQMNETETPSKLQIAVALICNRLWPWVMPRICTIFDHKLAETYADPESGQTTIECLRCGWHIDYFMS